MGSTAVHVFILAAGVIAGSSSVIFIKASSVPPVHLAAYRMILATIVLLPAYMRAVRKYGFPGVRIVAGKTVLSGIVLALHFVAWIAGSRLTLAANATLIVDMLPVVMPVIVYVIAGERVARREVLATFIALAGIALLVISDLGVGNMIGNLLCFASMLLYAIYLSLAKRNNSFPSIWLYVVPVYLIGGLLCLGISSLISPLTFNLPYRELIYIIGLAVIPTVIGHTALNYAMGKLRAQLVAIMTLGEFVFATVLAFIFFREIPSILFIPAAMLVIVGAVLVVGENRSASVEPPT